MDGGNADVVEMIQHPRDLARRPFAPSFVVAIAALIVGLLVITPWMVGAFYDDGTYLVLAKALASGQGYRHLNQPGAPAATHFPPGYPAFLAGLLMLAPDFASGVAMGKLANAALLPLAAIGAYTFCRRSIGWAPWPAAVVALLGMTAPGILAMNAALMSETLFLALLFPALIGAEAVARHDRGPAAPFALGALIGALQLVRSIGAPLVGALLLVLLVRRRWRDAALALVGAALVLAPWIGWVATHGHAASPALAFSYGSYREWLQPALDARGSSFVMRVFAHNLSVHGAYLGTRFMLVDSALLRSLAAASFLGAAAFGVVSLRRLVPVTLLFLGGYVALVLTWPFAPDRFYYLLEPFFAICVGAAIARSVTWWAGGRPLPRAVAALVLGAAALVAVGFAHDTIVSVRTRRWEIRQQSVHAALAPVVRWVARYTPPAAVVASDVDPMVYLYTGRRATPIIAYRAEYYLYPMADTAATVLSDTRALLREARPDYAVSRAGAPATRNVLARTLPTLPVQTTLAGVLTRGPAAADSGVVLRLHWTDQAPRR